MDPRIHVITIGVDDLERALGFYREGLGFESEGIIATEFVGDKENASGAIVMFHLQGGLTLSLYPRSELAKDAKVSLGPPNSGAFSLGHAVATRQEVDSTLSAAVAAGATLTSKAHQRPWGVYSGYFKDLDANLWEVLCNPELDLSASP